MILDRSEYKTSDVCKKLLGYVPIKTTKDSADFSWPH